MAENLKEKLEIEFDTLDKKLDKCESRWWTFDGINSLGNIVLTASILSAMAGCTFSRSIARDFCVDPNVSYVVFQHDDAEKSLQTLRFKKPSLPYTPSYLGKFAEEARQYEQGIDNLQADILQKENSAEYKHFEKVVSRNRRFSGYLALGGIFAYLATRLAYSLGYDRPKEKTRKRLEEVRSKLKELEK